MNLGWTSAVIHTSHWWPLAILAIKVWGAVLPGRCGSLDYSTLVKPPCRQPLSPVLYVLLAPRSVYQSFTRLWCASGCVVECRIGNQEVAGSNLGRGYFAPRCTQPSITPGSVNEYQLRLGRQRQVWLIPIGWTCGCAGKTAKSLENTCHTSALLRWWWLTSLRRCAISSVCTYTLPIPFMVHATCSHTLDFHPTLSGDGVHKRSLRGGGGLVGLSPPKRQSTCIVKMYAKCTVCNTLCFWVRYLWSVMLIILYIVYRVLSLSVNPMLRTYRGVYSI